MSRAKSSNANANAAAVAVSPSPSPSDLESIGKLTRDLKTASSTLTDREARYLVDSYYAVQDYRMQAHAQARQASKADEPHAVLAWLGSNMETLEAEIKKALGVYAESRRAGRWALSVYGIGPVIAAGLLAHIDVTRAKTAGAVWRFAGLDPTIVWEKGQKRPYNAKLKVLCWKIGQSFMKFSNREECTYGKLYRERKALEVERNAAGKFAEQAKAKLEKFKIKDAATKATYEAGKLPDGRLELRAERVAVKMFLSHFHHVLYESVLGEKPPKPWVIEHGGHVHVVEPPNWPCE